VSSTRAVSSTSTRWDAAATCVVHSFVARRPARGAKRPMTVSAHAGAFLSSLNWDDLVPGGEETPAPALADGLSRCFRQQRPYYTVPRKIGPSTTMGRRKVPPQSWRHLLSDFQTSFTTKLGTKFLIKLSFRQTLKISLQYLVKYLQYKLRIRVNKCSHCVGLHCSHCIFILFACYSNFARFVVKLVNFFFSFLSLPVFSLVNKDFHLALCD